MQGLPRNRILNQLFAVILIISLLLAACDSTENPESNEPASQPAEVEQTESIEEENSNTKPIASPATAEEEQPAETSEPEPGEVSAPSGSQADSQWTIILYEDADDEVLEEDMFTDLNEAEKVGSSDQMTIVSLIDRYEGGFAGDGNWTGTRRYVLTQDADLDVLNSAAMEELPEANMADGQTLVDFATWAIENYPAQKYALILSDHGMGWPGGWTDPNPDGEDQIYLHELESALSAIQASTGVDKFELIGFDACLMSHIEVFTAIAPYARYAVASQEVEPSLGWAYTAFLSALAEDPQMDGAKLSQTIVDSYIQLDQRIVDEEARLKFLAAAYGQNDDVPPEVMATSLGESVTLAAIDLEQVGGLVTALEGLTNQLAQAEQASVAEARAYAQSFESVFGEDVAPSYIDLSHFAQLTREFVNTPEVSSAVDGLLAAVDAAVIAEKHGPDRPGAAGISIYFPISDLYFGESLAGYEGYTTIATTFATASSWDDFLTFHYTGGDYQPIEGQASVPAKTDPVVAPGAGEITIQPLTLSSETSSIETPVMINTQVTGKNIGFIDTFIGYYDPESNAVLVADMDFLGTDGAREIGGVYYPDWGDSGVVDIEYEWTPTIFSMNDGVTDEFALFEPEDYGAPDEESIYSVQGLYTFAESGKQVSAILLFSAGELRQVFGFTNLDFTGAPREIIPSSGDTFTVLQQWIQLPETDGGEAEFFNQEGATFTFGEASFTWVEFEAPEGYYVVGIIVEDLDGNIYEEYADVVVGTP